MMIEGDRAPLSTFFLPPARGYRSANLLLDYDDPEVIRAYLPTRKSLAILDAIFEGLEEGQRDRAISLVAPYGSGKTSLLLFLSALLRKGGETQAAVREVLRRIEALAPTTAAAIRTHLRGHKGYLPVLLSGEAHDLASVFSRSLLETLDRCQLGELWHKRARSNRDALSEEASNPRDRIATVLERYRAIARALQKAGYKGILVPHKGLFRQPAGRTLLGPTRLDLRYHVICSICLPKKG